MSKSKSLWLLVLILIIAGGLRLYHLAELPPGLYPDEAMNGNNAVQALETKDFKIFYPENNGREGLFINIQALSIWAFGAHPWSLRFVSALIGILTVIGRGSVRRNFGRQALGAQVPKRDIRDIYRPWSLFSGKRILLKTSGAFGRILFGHQFLAYKLFPHRLPSHHGAVLSDLGFIFFPARNPPPLRREKLLGAPICGTCRIVFRTGILFIYRLPDNAAAFPRLYPVFRTA